MTFLDGQTMKKIENYGYKCLGNVQLDRVKEQEMREQFTKEYMRRLRRILKSQLNCKNKIKAINSYVVTLSRYGAGIVGWSE